MNPLVTSSLFDLGGSIFGSVFGGKKKRGPSPEDMIGFQSMGYEQQMDDTMRMARKHGIHPLVLFGGGAGQGYSPAFQFNSETGRDVDYEGLGQNIGRVAHAVSTRGEREFMDTMNGLQLERAHLENQLLASQISSVNRSMIPGRPDLDLPADPIGGQSYPRNLYAADPDGRIVPVWNENDLGENMFMSAHDYFTRGLPAEFKNLAGRTSDSFKRGFSRFHDFVRNNYRGYR